MNATASTMYTSGYWITAVLLAITLMIGTVHPAGAQETGGPTVIDPTSCGHFETQEGAQEAFDSGDLPDPENLDADGDGIVCEFRWDEGETDTSGPSTDGADTGTNVVALPDTGVGTAATGGHGAMLSTLLALVCAGGGLLLQARKLA